ncbi:MAG: outer membrane lipoprotein-sorting protein [Candidatus Alcyoniella australis]|nr:outer membrane lipoprotein-sorting protein [Candidatus Alcyoniella australis]
MRKIAFASIFALILGLAVAAMAADLSADEVAKKTMERDEGLDKVETMKMTIVTSNGKTKERTLQINKLYDDAGNMQLMRFVEPAKYKNYGFLSLQHKDGDDDRWMYMARQKKTVRIESSNQNDSFMNSDLSYYDMSDHDAADQTHELKGSAVIDGKDCWILSSVPKDKEIEYSRIETWVWKDQYVPLRLKMYDANGQLIKEGTAQRIEQINGFWTVMVLKIENVQQGSNTTLTILEIKHNQGLKPELFTLQQLENP